MRYIFSLKLFFVFLYIPAQSQFQAILLDEHMTKNANAVVRLDEMKINIAAVDKMTYVVNQVVTVLNKEGNHFAAKALSYDKETVIKSLDLYVYDKLGKEIEHIKKRDFQDISAVDGNTLYSDNRALVKKYVPVAYPYTISFSYAIETSDTAFLPPWYFLSDYRTSVEKSLYSISFANETLRPQIKEYNLEGIKFTKQEGTTDIVYQAESIFPIKYESLAPAPAKIFPRLRVKLNNFNLKGEQAHAENWKELGIWINNALLKDRADLEPATVTMAKQLVAGVTDDLEKAKIIYKYVQDNTRYISVQMGIGGWQPIAAVDVDRVKYGDCKGLSNYTHALLNAVGVSSYYTVIHAGSRKTDLTPDFASLQGNHAILAIPYKGTYYWIDCTSQVHPFGFVGDFTDDRLALVVTPDGGEIVNTVAYINEDNFQLTNGSYSLSTAGDIMGEVTLRTTGVQYDDRFTLEQRSNDEVLKHYKEYWGNINNLKLDKYHFENDRNQVVFKENVHVSASGHASINGDRMLFTANIFNNNGYVPDRYRDRWHPFEIARGFLDEDDITIELPDGYAIEALPSGKKVENEFGSYEISFENVAGSSQVRYKRRLFIKMGTYTKEKYANYYSFSKEIANSDDAQIVLIKK